jgi:hypothetical protein
VESRAEMKKGNMYHLSVKQWNPYGGCLHNCVYCGSSFQAQLKRWAKTKCSNCYTFKPHAHPERLNQSLPKTGYLQFIFTLANGDVSFCPTSYLSKIIKRIQAETDKWFLIQTKNPATFNRIKFPRNVILGTTIETNRDDLYMEISKAPLPSVRYKDFLKVNHPYKMVTCEPIIDFDVDIMLNWIQDINPVMIWLGYDSKKNYLPEPELRKVQILHWKLSKQGFIVLLKTIRKAWWE